jgi:hypothetical protein
MRENCAFEALEVLAWLEAELVGQRTTGVSVGGERLGLAARAVKRDHQLTE